MDVLLVASPYDSFLLGLAGQLPERMLGESRTQDLHYPPGLTADWDWLLGYRSESHTAHVRHVRLPGSLIVQMNGHRNEGVILKPEGRSRGATAPGNRTTSQWR